jgi:hypothetical protein
MINLALNKLPLEKEIWTNPEEATNGEFSGYTGKSGFAFATWPCTFTIDLESECLITNIRFLLWDGLGNFGNKIDTRKYKFSLSISTDDINYFTVYSNQNQEGNNGWFDFNFIQEAYARYVRITGHFNSANKEFHIVEFEVYEQEPQALSSINTHKIIISSVISTPSDKKINELIDNIISKRSKIFEGVEEKSRILEESILKSSQALNQIELIKKSLDYTQESKNNNHRSIKWLISSLITLITFICVLVWFVYCDDHALKIIRIASLEIAIQPYTAILLGAFYVTKALLLSTLLFIFTWMLKNYRSERHNYVINNHKAMTLTVATSILTKDEFQNTDRGNIFIQAMEIIFSHQSSGFTKDETSAPSILNTLLQKGISKGEN